MTAGDNAVVESLFATHEGAVHGLFESRAIPQGELFEFSESWYNRQILKTFVWPGPAVLDARRRAYLGFTGVPSVVTIDFETGKVGQINLGEPRAEILALSFAGDTLVVGGWDVRGGFAARVVPDGRVLDRTRLMTPPRTLATAPDGTLLFNGDIRTPDQAGFVLHAVSPSKPQPRSFKLAQPDSSNVFLVARRVGGGFWAVTAITHGSPLFAIEAWSAAGQRIKKFDAQSNWLRYAYGGDGRPTTPPPAFSSIGEDREGRLWLLGRVKKEEWQAGAAIEGNRLEIPLHERQYDLLYDSMVEAYDTRTGVLIMRQQLPGFGIVLDQHRRLLTLERTSDNRLSAALSELALVRR